LTGSAYRDKLKALHQELEAGIRSAIGGWIVTRFR